MKPSRANTVSKVQEAISPISKIGSVDGRARQIRTNVGGQIHNDPIEWARLDQLFQETKDSKGRSMKDICEEQFKD